MYRNSTLLVAVASLLVAVALPAFLSSRLAATDARERPTAVAIGGGAGTTAADPAAPTEPATTSPGESGAAPARGLAPGAEAAASRNLYVWYRRGPRYRWHGVGPYTLDEAYSVERDYIRRGYETYIGGRNG